MAIGGTAVFGTFTSYLYFAASEVAAWVFHILSATTAPTVIPLLNVEVVTSQ